MAVNYWFPQCCCSEEERETHKFGNQLGRSCLSCKLPNRIDKASNGYQPLMDSLWTLDLSFVSGMVRLNRTHEATRRCRAVEGWAGTFVVYTLEGRRGDRLTIHRPAILFSPQNHHRPPLDCNQRKEIGQFLSSSMPLQDS